MSTTLLSTVKKLVETKKPRTIGKNFAGPSMEKTKELSNLFVVFKTYFSNLLTTNLANIPLRKRKKRLTQKIKMRKTSPMQSLTIMSQKTIAQKTIALKIRAQKMSLTRKTKSPMLY